MQAGCHIASCHDSTLHVGAFGLVGLFLGLAELEMSVKKGVREKRMKKYKIRRIVWEEKKVCKCLIIGAR